MATKTKHPAKNTKNTVPQSFRIMEGIADTEFQMEAAAAEGEEKKLREFSMLAYTGGPMRLTGFAHPVIVDLAGLKVAAKSRPILRDHAPSQVVGHTTEIKVDGSSIRLKGKISGAGVHAQEVSAAADNGFPWQASIGASAEQVAFLDRGESTQVNGKAVVGPAYIARKATLREVSFVALGADDDTQAQLMATRAQGGPADLCRGEIQRLKAAGMSITAIAKEVNRLPKTLIAIEKGEGVSTVTASLAEKLKRIQTKGS